MSAFVCYYQWRGDCDGMLKTVTMGDGRKISCCEAHKAGMFTAIMSNTDSAMECD